ncbi:RNA polymerase sigma factor [Holdemania massiliensis]|uniref:RNA polymerase sigma factor n=1 Tax=Holdemania massiliensis TaxID=1468449 RepID=UPI001F06CD45|nr:RNA polymerase sigma factor [Holdemania massiliensis]MCH1939813.1 RNA polymerase sigma factor [Holdemania massiliensis]
MDKQISEALIEKVLDHQPQAVNELIAQLQPSIFNLALRMLGSIADAEDATQEILLLVLEKLPTFRGESALTTWVYRVAVNRLIDEKRSMFAQHPLSFDAYAQDIQAYQRESQREDKLILARELKLSCTNVMLQCLKPQDRCIFILGTMFKADSRQAAEILGLTPENYRQRLSRARRKMADFMSQYCYLASGGCRCTCRIDFAIGTQRLDPENLEYSKLPSADPQILHQHLEAMEKIEDHMTVFDQMEARLLPEEKQRHLQEVVSSVWMEKVCQN